jgi:ATP-binding cassette subfamily B protein
MLRIDFQHVAQFDGMDCGPSCLKAIAQFHGRQIPLHHIRQLSNLNIEGISLAGISNAADGIGLDSFCVQIPWEELESTFKVPCIIHWKEKHFIILYRITKNHVYISDPAKGNYTLKLSEFLKGWLSDRTEGVVAFLEPNSEFFETEYLETSKTKVDIIGYLKQFPRSVTQVLLALAFVSVIQLVLPFLTQSLVDYGISYQRYDFIIVILVAQLVLVILQAFLHLVRDWHLLQISANINMQLVNDFLIHLISLPMSYFVIRSEGDLLQRIEDNEVLEEFVSDGALGVLFDMVSLFLFALILGFFSPVLLMVYVIGTLGYLTWFLFFMKKRASLDKAYFKVNGKVKSHLLQLLRHMEDIKVNSSFGRRLGNWQQAQRNHYYLNGKLLKLNQYQITISNVIHQFKNLILLFLAAKMVMVGTMTLGTLLAILFIIAQMNVPLENLTRFILDFQRVRLAFNRLAEIQNEPIETEEHSYSDIPKETIFLKNIGLRFGASNNGDILKDVNLIIPKGKVTAIVGKSGSGKTTLFKLLLGFLKPTKGTIEIGEIPLSCLSLDFWRNTCGVVLQEGNLFEDTIENNITEGRSDEPFNQERYLKAIRVALLEGFIDGLPYGNKTKVGANGMQVSGGEKQRILIARAVYKDGDYYFLDEPTSALDAHNENNLIRNFLSACKGKTVVIIAHRLSTIKDADQIAVMEEGSFTEIGKHEELLSNRGVYYQLIQNQLHYAQR